MKSLTHNGVLFPKEYEYKRFDNNLNALAEEMLYHYALKLNTNYVNDEFNNNFYSCFKQELNSDYLELQFPNDFMKTINKMIQYNNNLPTSGRKSQPWLSRKLVGSF